MRDTKKLILMIDNEELKEKLLQFLSSLKYDVLVLKNNISINEHTYSTTENVIVKSKNLYEVHRFPVIVIEECIIEENISLNNPKIGTFQLVCASIYDEENNIAFESRVENTNDYDLLKQFIQTKLREFENPYIPTGNKSFLKGFMRTVTNVAREAFRIRKSWEIHNPSNVIGFNKIKKVLSKGSI